MPLPSNAELRETNDALKSKVQELKEAHSKDQDTIAQMMAKIDALTVENAALQQNNSQNEDVQDTLQVQRPVPVSVPNTSSSQPPVSVPNTSSSQPPVKAQKIPLPPMEKFDGQSSSVTEWWITFMSFVTLHQMPEASAITALPFYLTGIAQQWFLHLAPQFKVSLNKVGEAFFKRFKPKEPINKEVLRVNQAPGETVDQYLFRVRRLAADSTMDENLVTFFALEGLLEKLRTIVVPQQPQSLEELREQANIAETAVRHKPMDAPSMNIAAAVQEGIKAAAGTIKETVEATVDDRLGHFGRRTNGPDRTRHRPQRAQANSDSTNVCYRCGGLFAKSWCGLLALLVMVFMVATTDAKIIRSDSVDTLQRLNYGVMFQPTSRLILSQEYWTHTFHLRLPEPIGPTSTQKCQSNSSYCIMLNDIISTVHNIHIQTQGHVNQVIKSVKSLIPSTDFSSNSKSVRAFLPFIGSLSRSLFGTATIEDVQILASHVNALNSQTRNFAKAMQHTEARLSSFMTVVDKKTTNLLKGIELNKMIIENLTVAFNEKLVALEKILTNVSSMMVQQINEAIEIRSNLANFQSAVQKHEKLICTGRVDSKRHALLSGRRRTTPVHDSGQAGAVCTLYIEAQGSLG
ncbi:hypothetical protein FSP39_008986 [Pinctada imbricata]|uniref:Retrotransposon gag domain-containing protein n=1 Tax=Pinctada imbricata TaxID=66713 RepID=A0AA88Y3E8_PINIB|nr:hypothetical protein FSP39_008986 [Pinctada imbricata]